MVEIQKSINLKKELDALRPLKKEDELRIMDKFRLDWNYHSNHLEGNTLTYGETKALILFGITAQGKPLKDHFEITGHNEAIKWITEIVHQNRPLTENFIRELHKLLLKESYEVPSIRPDGEPSTKKITIGAYKTTPNHVRTLTGEIFRFASPEETPAMMFDLLSWYNTSFGDSDVNPILLAAEFHYKFIRIHPFDDGNGRTARILMNFILMQNGYPPVIIKTEDKKNYFAALRQADAGIIEPFINYIAKNLNRSLEIMISGAKGENVEDPDDIDKEIALLAQKVKNIGKEATIDRNKEILLDFFDKSVLKLSRVFLEKSSLFDHFYTKSQCQIVMHINQGSSAPRLINEDRLAEIRERITDKTSSIVLVYEYNGFEQTGFQGFNHRSRVAFQFKNTSYQIENSDNLSIEKKYGEQLSDDEITALVNGELKKHKLLIEIEIKKIGK